jgi:hypothetical protein
VFAISIQRCGAANMPHVGFGVRCLHWAAINGKGAVLSEARVVSSRLLGRARRLGPLIYPTRPTDLNLLKTVAAVLK